MRSQATQLTQTGARLLARPSSGGQLAGSCPSGCLTDWSASAAFAWRVAACKEQWQRLLSRGCEGRLSADTKPSPCNLPQRLWEPDETDRADLDVRGTQEGPHRV
jgi:hypothetical protein